jgi:hypothetical protein
MNDVERVVIQYFKVLYQHLYGGTEENQDDQLSGQESEMELPNTKQEC